MKRHEPDWTSLIAGVTFCGIALAYLGGEVVHRSLELRWVVPILLIGLGLAGLAGTIVRARRVPLGTSPTYVANPSYTGNPVNAAAPADAASPDITIPGDTEDGSAD